MKPKPSKFSWLPDVDWRAYAVLAAGFFTAAIYSLPDLHMAEGLLAVAIITICVGIYIDRDNA